MGAGGRDRSGVQALLRGVPDPGSQFLGSLGRLRCPWSRPPGPRPLRCDMGRDSLSAALPARWGLLLLFLLPLFFFFLPRASAPAQLGRGGLSPEGPAAVGPVPRGRGGRASGGTCPGGPLPGPGAGLRGGRRGGCEPRHPPPSGDSQPRAEGPVGGSHPPEISSCRPSQVFKRFAGFYTEIAQAVRARRPGCRVWKGGLLGKSEGMAAWWVLGMWACSQPTRESIPTRGTRLRGFHTPFIIFL